MTSAQRFLALLVGLSAVAVALQLVSRRARLPYAVVLAAGGVVVGLLPGVPETRVGPDVILLAFVPGLVFEATLTLDLDNLRHLALPVSLLATAGVGLTVTAIGALAHAWLGFTWTDGMLLGAILAPTDPIAVVAVLRGIGAPPRLVALMEGESLFNDGTGVAVFAAVAAAVAGGSPSGGDVLLRLVTGTLGGAGIGLVAGALGVALLGAFHEARSEILVTLTVAYGGYLAADLADVSGIVAVVVAGVVIAAAGRRLRIHGRELLDVWGVVAFVLNAILFLLIGSALPIRRVFDVAGSVVAATAIMVAVRALPVYGLLTAVDPRARLLPWRWRHVAMLGGMRGALSVALALSLAGRAHVDPKVRTTAYGVVLLSLLLQGLLVRPATRLLTPDAAG